MATKPRTVTLSLRYFILLLIANVAIIVSLTVLFGLQINSKTADVPVPTPFDASRDWGAFSAYTDNAGTSLASTQRLPEASFGEGLNNERFANKVTQWQSQASKSFFTGSLTFLNDYQYTLQDTGALTRTGAATAFQRGTAIWNLYGEYLYGLRGTQADSRAKPFFRSTSSNHVTASVPYWIAGFTGVPDEANVALNTSASTPTFDYLLIPEAGDQNDTLASYQTCANADVAPIYEIGDEIIYKYIPIYLQDALVRLESQVPSKFALTVNDLYAMQSICAFETSALGSSPFCSLFTPPEWEAFSYTSDQEFYYDSSFGNPTGRAQGIGYLQELLARLRSQYIDYSNSTVNSTLDDEASDFPLGRKLYADFTHSTTIVSLLTAMSMDYFRDPPGLGKYPVPAARNFRTANIVPSGANLVTEVIGCEDSDPKPVKEANYWTKKTAVSSASMPESSLHKFIRMRLNQGILPLASIRGGACKDRSDGMCVIDKFLESQARAYEMSNFDYACYADIADAIGDPTSGRDWDGTIHKGDGPA